VDINIAYEYRLEAVLADETVEVLGIASYAPTPQAFSIIKLYPNPASDYMTCLFSLPEAGVVEIELYDLTGRMVLEEQVEVGEPMELPVQLEVSSLASGVYTLWATCGGAQASARCVVVR